MKIKSSNIPRLESLLAMLLKYGTGLASAVTGLGLILALIEGQKSSRVTGPRIISCGIALFILMPVLRVILMLTIYLLEKD